MPEGIGSVYKSVTVPQIVEAIQRQHYEGIVIKMFEEVTGIKL